MKYGSWVKIVLVFIEFLKLKKLFWKMLTSWIFPSVFYQYQFFFNNFSKCRKFYCEWNNVDLNFHLSGQFVLYDVKIMMNNTLNVWITDKFHLVHIAGESFSYKEKQVNRKTVRIEKWIRNQAINKSILFGKRVCGNVLWWFCLEEVWTHAFGYRVVCEMRKGQHKAETSQAKLSHHNPHPSSTQSTYVWSCSNWAFI